MLDRNSPFLRTADPKRRDSLADLAFRGLRDAIIGCDPAPGAIVTEAGLAERFAYGLAATRAALARLFGARVDRGRAAARLAGRAAVGRTPGRPAARARSVGARAGQHCDPVGRGS
jgi:hypothetical protein